MRRLIPMGDELRSYLGTVALLVFVLPAVVLVLTLLDEDSAPRPMQTSDSGKGNSEVAQRQARFERGGDGEGDVRPIKRHGVSRESMPEDDRASPTRQTGPDQEGLRQSRDASGTAIPTGAPTLAEQGGSQAAPSVPPAEPAPANTEVPTPLTPSSAPAATAAPATAAPSTPVAATTPPASDQSAPTIAAPIPTPIEVPLDGAQDHGISEGVAGLR